MLRRNTDLGSRVWVAGGRLLPFDAPAILQNPYPVRRRTSGTVGTSGAGSASVSRAETLPDRPAMVGALRGHSGGAHGKPFRCHRQRSGSDEGMLRQTGRHLLWSTLDLSEKTDDGQR